MMFPLAAFLRILEQDGFRLTVRDYDRIALVLATDGEWTLARLRSVLRTLLVRNEEQQELFARRFTDFFAELPEATFAGTEIDAAINLDAIRSELELLRPGRHRGLPLRYVAKTGNDIFGKPLTEKRHAWLRLGLFLCILLSVLVVIFLPSPLQEDVVLPETSAPQETKVQQPEPTADINNLPRYVVQPRRPVIASRELTPLAGNDAWKQTAGIAAGIFLLCLLYGLYLYRAQRVPKDEPAFWKKDDPTLPRLFPLDRVGGKPASRIDRETLSHLADCLGYFQSDRPGREPDILRSVAATAEHAGLPSMVFPQKKELRRVIILVNQSNPEALRLNPLAGELRAGLTRLGVQLVFGRYYDDPAIFYPEDGRMRFLADYEAGRNGYLLLIFSAQVDRKRYGHTLEELARWPYLAWMQLRTDRFQQDAAVSTRYGIATYPATKAGLLAAFTRFLTESTSRQEVSSGARQAPLLRGDADINMQLETRLGDALPWAQACALLQPTPLGLADGLRREFFARLAPERIERLMGLPGSSLGKGGISFSSAVREVLEQGFFTRFEQGRQEEILQYILTELEKSRDRALGDQASVEGSLAYLAWQKHYQLLNIHLKPDQALKGLAVLEGTPLEYSLKASLEGVNPIPLRERLARSKDSLQRLARLFGKRSGLSLLKRYPLSWLQWGGAVVLVLALLMASGLGIQQWQGAGQGEVRLSVLAEESGGTGWVGVEESGSTPKKRSSTEGLLRLPVETRLSLRKEWQLVFYDQELQPAYTVDLGSINENQLVRLRYEKVEESQGKTGELVVTDKERNVLRDSEITLRGPLFAVTARANRTLVLPIGKYDIQPQALNINTAWHQVTVLQNKKEVLEIASDQKNAILSNLKNNEIDKVEQGKLLSGSSENFFGKFHALVIGNQNYKYLSKLRTPESDAIAVANILEKKYNFAVKLLIDADRYQIMREIYLLRKNVNEEKSNLLIYYAGYAALGWPGGGGGYWLPVDAEPEVDVNWIPMLSVLPALKAIPAKHVLVVSDGFELANSLLRDESSNPLVQGDSSDPVVQGDSSNLVARHHGVKLIEGMPKIKWLQRMFERRSRTVLTSGGNEFVMDSAGGRHSVFAKAFLEELEKNQEILDGDSLFDQVKYFVVLNSYQTPQYANIRMTGHDGGDFLFVPAVIQRMKDPLGQTKIPDIPDREVR
ncbi:MAG: caspase family protein [Candidatus Electrothrix aestuarii]|uniref:Caspase family protein n=1 Tax=Candidatus Electrothrix aestuarii TaxID=3062594 RepID=A0AAU8LX87_9BACT|nr:caspase family protein [Candidatus Electrothrix aestuarii]